MNKSVTIQFDISLKNLYSASYNVSFKKLRFIVIIPVIIFLINIISDISRGETFNAISISVPLLISPLFLVLVFRYQIKKNFKSNPHIYNNLKYVFHEDSIDIKSDNTDSTLNWFAFDKFVQTKDLIIFVQQKVVMFIIPKNSFKTKEDLDTVINWSKQHLPEK